MISDCLFFHKNHSVRWQVAFVTSGPPFPTPLLLLVAPVVQIMDHDPTRAPPKGQALTTWNFDEFCVSPKSGLTLAKTLK